jgi:hypothetical protein
MSEIKHIIGIDPSLKTAGCCIYTPESKEMRLYSGTWCEVVDWLSIQKVLKQSVVIIEDPNLDSNTFGAWGRVKAEILRFQSRKCGLGEVQSAFLVAAKMAQHIGESKASAKVFIELFKKARVPFARVAPSDRDRADKDLYKPGNLGLSMLVMPTKTNAHQFQTLTGYSGRSNDDARDAATLVHGRGITWALNMVQIEREKSGTVEKPALF